MNMDEEFKENIEIVFKMCQKPDAECIHENENSVTFIYDETKIARFAMTEREDDFLVEVSCLKSEMPFFENKFALKWTAIIEPEFQMGTIYGNIPQ